LNLDSGLVQHFDHLHKLGGIGGDTPGTIILLDIFRTDFKREFEKLFFGGSGSINRDQAFPLEGMAYGTLVGHAIACFRETQTHFRCRPVFIIGQDFDDQADASRTVALVGQLLIDGGIRKLTRPLLDRPINIVGGHIDRTGLGNQGPQGGIIFGVTAASASTDSDLLCNFAEDFSTLGVLCAFAVFDICPFTMSSHRFSVV
jgi:hypothetical protein